MKTTAENKRMGYLPLKNREGNVFYVSPSKYEEVNKIMSKKRLWRDSIIGGVGNNIFYIELKNKSLLTFDKH